VFNTKRPVIRNRVQYMHGAIGLYVNIVAVCTFIRQQVIVSVPFTNLDIYRLMSRANV